jgi:hypothetical protein
LSANAKHVSAVAVPCAAHGFPEKVTMPSIILKGAAVAAALALGGYWYWSPVLTVRQMQAAAQKRDADAFNEHADYPKLRESYKDEFSANMRAKMSDAGNAAAHGYELQLAKAEHYADVLARPEPVMRAMRHGPIYERTSYDDEASLGKPIWTYERKGVNTLIAYATDPNQPDAPREAKWGLMFQRNGFTDWKLTEFRLPTQ